jgi:AAA+ ATPase superfamily predicted ATPase
LPKILKNSKKTPKIKTKLKNMEKIFARKLRNHPFKPETLTKIAFKSPTSYMIAQIYTGFTIYNENIPIRQELDPESKPKNNPE